MNARWLFLCSALMLLFANGSCASDAGAYQRAKDGKTLVWKNHPTPEDAAAWSGERDTGGYATGYGTLIWSITQRPTVTGSNISTAKYTVIGRYSGNMVHGKWDGPVTADVKGKKFHATFADGKKASRWTAGRAPGSSVPRDESVSPPRPDRTDIAANQQRNESVERDAVVEAPAEGPAPVPEHPPLQSDGAKRQADQHVSAPAVSEAPRPAVDDSLRSLMSPPSLLRNNPGTEPSPQASASIPSTSTSPSPPARSRLTAAEVIELADAEARTQGYNLGEYQHPHAHYTAADDTWLVSYDQKSVDSNAMGEMNKNFSVSVEDETKKTSIVPER